jgi:hypothetical protein
MTNEKTEQQGWALLQKYIWLADVAKADTKEAYTVTDAITALLHHANAQGFDVAAILRSAEGHFDAETWSCPGCKYVGARDMHMDCPNDADTDTAFLRAVDAASVPPPDRARVKAERFPDLVERKAANAILNKHALDALAEADASSPESDLDQAIRHAHQKTR